MMRAIRLLYHVFFFFLFVYIIIYTFSFEKLGVDYDITYSVGFMVKKQSVVKIGGVTKQTREFPVYILVAFASAR